MKVRHGFVSNSSSSSFMIVAAKEDHDIIMNNLSDELKEIINNTFQKVKIGSIEAYAHGNLYSPTGESVMYFDKKMIYCDDLELNWDIFWTAINEYRDIAKDKNIKILDIDLEI